MGKVTVKISGRNDSKGSFFPEALTTNMSQFTLYFVLIPLLHSTPSNSHQTPHIILTSKSCVSAHLKANSRRLSEDSLTVFMNVNPFTYLYLFFPFKSSETRQSKACERHPEPYPSRLPTMISFAQNSYLYLKWSSNTSKCVQFKSLLEVNICYIALWIGNILKLMKWHIFCYKPQIFGNQPLEYEIW